MSKLNEQLENAPIVYDKELNLIKNYERIVDEFAIGFAEWFSNLKYNESRYKTNEELLEIYKKEKGYE